MRVGRDTQSESSSLDVKLATENRGMALEISTIKGFILEHLQTIHTIGDVAAPFDISPGTLRKEFQRKARIPLSKYLVLSRVERAKHLLISTELKCFEICQEVGFQREDTGSAIFKRVAGVNMNSYRSSHKVRLSSTQESGPDFRAKRKPR